MFVGMAAKRCINFGMCKRKSLYIDKALRFEAPTTASPSISGPISPRGGNGGSSGSLGPGPLGARPIPGWIWSPLGLGAEFPLGNTLPDRFGALWAPDLWARPWAEGQALRTSLLVQVQVPEKSEQAGSGTLTHLFWDKVLTKWV